MSTEENTTEETVEVSIEDFEKDFFEVKEEIPAEDTEDTTEEVVQETDDEEDDTLATENDETSEEEEEDSTDEEETSEEEATPKKSRAQERIEELNSKYREEEREKLAALEELARLKKQLEQNDKEPKPEPKVEVTEDTGPRPDDTNEDGSDKYPLGEFDPLYLKDVIAHTLKMEREERDREDANRKVQEARDAEIAAVQKDWNEKLDPAKERYPDFEEKGQDLIDSFSDLDQSYGEYLTTVLMSMDYGPDVLYYLANNPDEARSIVNSGAAKATIALGRLESKFVDAADQKQKARPKVSKAPAPPPQNKGSMAAKGKIDATSADVDLDALAKELAKGGY